MEQEQAGERTDGKGAVESAQWIKGLSQLYMEKGGGGCAGWYNINRDRKPQCISMRCFPSSSENGPAN